jgi:hypothetical protein
MRLSKIELRYPAFVSVSKGNCGGRSVLGPSLKTPQCLRKAIHSAGYVGYLDM